MLRAVSERRCQWVPGIGMVLPVAPLRQVVWRERARDQYSTPVREGLHLMIFSSSQLAARGHQKTRNRRLWQPRNDATLTEPLSSPRKFFLCLDLTSLGN